MFGKDEIVINNTRVMKCDIDAQPGIFSIVGIPNSAFINTNVFESNLTLLNHTALTEQPTVAKVALNKRTNLSGCSSFGRRSKIAVLHHIKR
jgi:hypothetical protein